MAPNDGRFGNLIRNEACDRQDVTRLLALNVVIHRRTEGELRGEMHLDVARHAERGIDLSTELTKCLHEKHSSRRPRPVRKEMHDNLDIADRST